MHYIVDTRGRVIPLPQPYIPERGMVSLAETLADPVRSARAWLRVRRAVGSGVAEARDRVLAAMREAGR